jgi:hypothetical protein
LEHYGLLQSTTHPDVSNVGKDDCLLFELDDHGTPRGLRFFPKGQVAVLWKHSKGNHNSFPAIRVQQPLLSVSESIKIDDAEWNKAAPSEKRLMLLQLDYSAINPACTSIKMTQWSASQLAPVLNSGQPELAALKRLVSVFPREEQQYSFMQNLTYFLQEKIQQLQIENLLDFIKKLLVGTGESGNKKSAAGCLTYYDMYETEKYENLVFTSITRYALIWLLNGMHTAKDSERQANLVVSPFSGVKTIGVGDKYPNPNMPLLGLTYLYSKKSDLQCLTRYTMTGAGAFQAGMDEVRAISDAIAFLTADSRKDKSWRAINDSNHDKPNLLLAYLPDDPQNNAFLAKILGAPSDYDDLEEYREKAEVHYEKLCKQVLGDLKDVLLKNPNTKVHLILMGSLDLGRKQVVYETSFTARRLRENLITWGTASKNTPPTSIRIWDNRKNIKGNKEDKRDKHETILVQPICPGPSEICQMFKLNYTRSGSVQFMKQSSVSFHEIYQLYMPDLQTERSQLLEFFFQAAIQKSRWLLGDTAHQLTVGYALPSTRQSLIQARDAVQFVSLISILLYLSDVRKEKYMLDTPFNVGQLLKLADMLHKEYSIQVRNGGDKRASLPTQLMGNEMLITTSENPAKGLNRLCDRMRIYYSWAYTATDENARLAKWILARFEEVSRKIATAEDGLPEQFSPVQQAQVFLGYLADISYEKKKQDPASKPETADIELNIEEDNSDG